MCQIDFGVPEESVKLRMVLNAELHCEPSNMIPAPNVVPLRFIVPTEDTSAVGFDASTHCPPVTEE